MTSLPKRNKVDVYRDGFSPQSTYFSIASRPSLVRQPMRNDFPLLACLELGARHVRLPLTDLEDPIQKAPIDLLRDEGVQITATWLWAERHDVALQVARHLDLVDDVEVQVPGAVLPPETCLRQIHRCAVEWHRPVTLATVIAREIVAGKQHPRTRIGYRAIDWVVDLAGADDRERLNRAAEAVFAGALLPKTRVFLDPLIDLDRTMDVIPGLLDRQCNPRPSFHAARCLNSILFGSPEPRILAAAPEVAGARIIGARGPTTIAWLLLPSRSDGPVALDVRRLEGFQSKARAARQVDLATGTSRTVDLEAIESAAPILEFTAATLLVGER